MNIGLCGLGRAGKEFVKYVLPLEKFELKEVLCRAESLSKGQTVENYLGIVTPYEIDIVSLENFTNAQKLEVIVDFSKTATSMKLVDLCCKFGINLVICTTDFTDTQLKSIEEKVTAANIGCVYAPTLTIGINMIMNLVKSLARLFQDFSFEIIERHDKIKSVPSKTSEIISAAINRADTKIHSVRLNGYVGIHEITATDGYERITVTHESFSRIAFVRGALFACEYICNKKGFYHINDVVNRVLNFK